MENTLVTETTEGVRIIRHGGNEAEYHITSLPDGRWGITTDLRCNRRQEGYGVHLEFATREECLAEFVQMACRFFKDDSEMLARLDGGLFGFTEPEVDQKRTTEDAEITALVASLWKRYL